MYSFFLLAVFMAGQSLGHPEIVITLSFVASQLIILIFGIFYIISVFYFSNDMSILIPLPIKPGEVLGVKFITILLSEYLIALPMLLPAFIIYGAGSWQGILYWLGINSDTYGTYTTLGYCRPDRCSANAFYKYSKRQGYHGNNREPFGAHGGFGNKLLFSEPSSG